MNINKRFRYLIKILCICLLVTGSQQAFFQTGARQKQEASSPASVSQEPVRVIIDGTATHCETPLIFNGCIMVEALMTGLGYTISWNTDSGSLTAVKNDFCFEVTDGSRTVKLNEQNKTMVMPAVRANNTLYVPVRPLVEWSGGTVRYDYNSHEIYITSQQQRISNILNSNSIEYNQVFLAGDNPENPLHVWRLPITQMIAAVADCILAGRQNLTPHQKIIAFMHFMDDFTIGTPSDYIPEHILIEKKASCGSFTNILLALAATEHIPGRIISLANYPENNGHVVSELYIDGEWMLYDPTFGSYYTDQPDNSVSPHVLSFTELRSGLGRAAEVKCIIGRPQKPSPGQMAFLQPDIYEKADPAGPIDFDKPFVYPLWLDLKSKPQLNKGDLNYKNQGSSYLGAGGICQLQKWTLKSLEPGKKYVFTIIPGYVSGEKARERGSFQAEAAVISGGSLQGAARFKYPVETQPGSVSPWEIYFVASSTETSIMLTHPYRGPDLFYLSMSGYSLKKAE